ncbi:MAG: DUF1559 domain-containing protein, partial [Planctomycetales bacterium]
RGFTLIELLVVIAIIAVLATLLLSAVQAVRQTAHTLQCTNNLRQIGLALHNYHSLTRRFPPGGVEWRPWGNSTKRQLAWSAFLLPFVEQQSLHDQLDLSKPFDAPENAVPAAVQVSVYLCPSVVRNPSLVRGATDYGGMYGERITSPNNPPKGVMIYDVAFALVQIRDGASNTIMVSEDSRGPDKEWINGRNLFDQAYRVNQAPRWENDMRSEHGGGANALFADSRVLFVSESTDLKVLAALCTREGREINHNLR